MADAAPAHERVRWQWAVAWRALRIAAAIALAGGFAVSLVLAVANAWLAAAVAGGSALLASALFAVGRSSRPATTDSAAALEGMGTGEQLGQAFARTAIVLAAFSAGLYLALALGLGRA